LLVPFVRGKANGHLGNNTSKNGSETFVEGKRCFALYDLNSCLDEAATGALEVLYQIDCSRKCIRIGFENLHHAAIVLKVACAL